MEKNRQSLQTTKLKKEGKEEKKKKKTNGTKVYMCVYAP
jgi:hypothetical protein